MFFLLDKCGFFNTKTDKFPADNAIKFENIILVIIKD